MSPDCVISEAQASKLLDVLCVQYGFCLPPLWQARLTKNPPRSVERFTDTVFRAEGLDPRTSESDLYRDVLVEVKMAYEASAQERRAENISKYLPRRPT